MNCNDQLSSKEKLGQNGIKVGSCIQTSSDADQASSIKYDIHRPAFLKNSTEQLVGCKTFDNHHAYEPINEICQEARNIILKWQNENPVQVQNLVPFRSMESTSDLLQPPRRYHRRSKKDHLG